MTPEQQNYENLSRTMIKKLEQRAFTAEYTPTAADALEAAKACIKPGMTFSTGGSMTLDELGLQDALTKTGAEFIDYRSPKTQEEKDAAFARVYTCDCYYMSSNAITKDGILVNIDGNGNRLSAMLYGPKKVVIIVSMNKVCRDVESAYQRIKMTVAPRNAVRLSKKTPCTSTGVCADCLSPDCICNHIVVTRRSGIPQRIHIILCGEELGY